MKNFLKKIVAVVVPLLLGGVAAPAFAATSISDLVPCSGGACDWCSVFALLQKVFNTAEVIVFPLIVIYIIYGATLYIISATSGSEEGISKARSTVTDAIIGLVIVMLTFIIVNATIIGIAGNQISIQSIVGIQCETVNELLPPAGQQLQLK